MAQPLIFTRCPMATASSSGKLITANPLFFSPFKFTTTTTRTQNLGVQYRRLHQGSTRRAGVAIETKSLLQHQNYRPQSQNHRHQIPQYQQPPSSRQYHSQFHPSLPLHEYTNSQTTILSAALEHVPEHGFTLKALTLGARDSGFLDVSVQLLPRGEFDLVLFWLASRRGLLRGKVENGFLETEGRKGLSVEDKTKELIIERLMMNEKVKGQWQGALALMSIPSNIPLSLSELHALSSDILTLAGDSSVDASWYTKRLAVSAIYASADTVMTQDSSPDFAATKAFVDRRVEDSKAVGEKVDGVRQCLGFLGSTAVGLGRSWGLKI